MGDIDKNTLDKLAAAIDALARQSNGPISSVQSGAINDLMASAETLSPVQMNLQKSIVLMQTWVKNLNNSGVPLGVLNKQITDLTGNAKVTEQVMGKFKKSLSDLAKMSPKEFFKKEDFTSNISSLLKSTLGTVAFDMAAVFESVKYAFKGVAALDRAGIDLNKTLLLAAAQTNKLGGKGGTGVGGLFGRLDIADSIRKQLDKSILQAGVNLRPLGIKEGATYELIGQVISKGLRSHAGEAPGIASAAAYAQRDFGVPLEVSAEYFSSVMRRTGKTGDDLVKTFQGTLDAVKKTNLVNSEGVSTVLDLWNASRLFGGSLRNANEVLVRYHSQLENQTMTAQQFGSMQQSAINAPVQSIAALFSWAKLTGSSSLQTIFGGAKSIPEALGQYISRGGALGAELPGAIADIIKRKTMHDHPGVSTAALTGFEMINAQGIMQTMPLQLQRSVMKILEPSLFPSMSSINGRVRNAPGDVDDTANALSKMGQQARNASQTLQNLGEVLGNVGAIIKEKILGSTRGVGVNVPAETAKQGKFVLEILLRGGELFADPVGSAAGLPFEIAVKKVGKHLRH